MNLRLIGLDYHNMKYSTVVDMTLVSIVKVTDQLYNEMGLQHKTEIYIYFSIKTVHTVVSHFMIKLGE